MRLGGRVNGQTDGGGRSDAEGSMMGPESNTARPRIHISMGETLLESMGNAAVSNEVESIVNRSRGRDGEMDGGQEVEAKLSMNVRQRGKWKLLGMRTQPHLGAQLTIKTHQTFDRRSRLGVRSMRVTDNMWYEAMVEGTTSSRDRLIVRFLGWSRKWNATLPRSSDREIAQFKGS